MDSRRDFCPTCKSNKTECFYEFKNAPITSVALVNSKKDAIEIERKNISLTFCNNCGLIFNSAFDNTLDYFTSGYEDQQGYSQTFNSFISGITQELIDKYNLYNKLILEIGCGKGDFLKLISKLGNNRGIGIDPACDPKRGEVNNKVKFIKEFYAQKHGSYLADCICCRHTLEHIPETSQFLKLISNSINKEKEPILFFEVPDSIRILEKQAFWDIYYEHPNYFSPGSLARLFRMNQFTVLNLYTKNDNQYLFIETKPSEKNLENIHPHEESVNHLKNLVDQFKNGVERKLNFWRKTLKKIETEKQKVVIWGGGSKAVGFLTQFSDIQIFDYVIDINPYLKDKFIPGFGVQYKSPDFLAQYKPEHIIIMNCVYKDEITRKLRDLNLNPKLQCLD